MGRFELKWGKSVWAYGSQKAWVQLGEDLCAGEDVHTCMSLALFRGQIGDEKEDQRVGRAGSSSQGTWN